MFGTYLRVGDDDFRRKLIERLLTSVRGERVISAHTK